MALPSHLPTSHGGERVFFQFNGLAPTGVTVPSAPPLIFRVGKMSGGNGLREGVPAFLPTSPHPTGGFLPSWPRGQQRRSFVRFLLRCADPTLSAAPKSPTLHARRLPSKGMKRGALGFESPGIRAGSEETRSTRRCCSRRFDTDGSPNIRDDGPAAG